jgi:hypothetical protein
MVEVRSGASSVSMSLEMLLGRRPPDGVLVELTGGFHAAADDDYMHVGACSP